MGTVMVNNRWLLIDIVILHKQLFHYKLLFFVYYWGEYIVTSKHNCNIKIINIFYSKNY